MSDSPSLQPIPGKLPPAQPDYSAEAEARRLGWQTVCGTDEAGRGPLAGPVVAAAVVLDPQNIPVGLNDSKKLTGSRREALFAEIIQGASVSVASASSRQVDELNVRNASLLAMRRAIDGLEQQADHVLVDGNATPPGLACGATAIIKGDARSVSIAAASIVAKVVRDRIMRQAAMLYPAYGFENHKGYGTAMHMQALREHGPCPLHRLTFAPVAQSALEFTNE